MENPQNHIVIVAGEASGDMHAADLVRQMKSFDPSLKFSGLGGEEMRRAGVMTPTPSSCRSRFVLPW